MISAVIFDMDGLMFDTERLGFQSMTRAARELGLEGMEALYEQMIGSNQHDCRELFIKAYGSDRLYPELCRMESAYRRALIEENGLPVKKGLYPLLEDLRAQQLPVALATSSKRQTADYYLSLAGLTGYFDAIITGEQVLHSKPNPEIYQKAASLLGIAPEFCAAMEDSFHGIRSAYAGGLIPVMIPDIKQPDDEMRQKAAAILPDLLAAKEWIRNQNSSAE